MNNKPIRKAMGRVVKRTDMPDLSKSFSTTQLAQAITAKRTGLKIKLVDLAEILSISKPTLIKIERGDTSVKLANILKVMEYLGLSFSIISDDLTQSNNMSGVSEDDWY